MGIPHSRPFLAILLVAAFLAGAAGSLLGLCGAFADVMPDAFCPFVLEVFYMGITTGTSPTTYDPASAVSRLQMAAFLSRTVDGVVHRVSRRIILNQAWTQLNFFNPLSLGPNSFFAQSDGTDVWVASRDSGVVRRIRASDGYLLSTFRPPPSSTGNAFS
ncbi:MAG TPA: hypothetical protein VKH43_04760 [Thermoanaerobaculia bacterium]|nr:hypothetical protein [Thermoanaerobaculia bacterium]